MVKQTLRDWVHATFNKNEIADIARHGCDAGWQNLTYTKDILELYDTFEHDIHDELESIYGDGVGTGKAWVEYESKHSQHCSPVHYTIWLVYSAVELICSEWT